MSTRAQIAIQTGPEEWAHVYCHYDGYPSHMLPALARWMPEDILAARELRQCAPINWTASTRRARRASCRIRPVSSATFTTCKTGFGTSAIRMLTEKLP